MHIINTNQHVMNGKNGHHIEQKLGFILSNDQVANNGQRLFTCMYVLDNNIIPQFVLFFVLNSNICISELYIFFLSPVHNVFHNRQLVLFNSDRMFIFVFFTPKTWFRNILV